jgi:hypothetical protein
MGRGLSELQRFILREAGKRGRAYYADVLTGFFGWKPTPSRLPRTPGQQRFSRSRIGERRYAKTMATLSRACWRLGQRGLVTCLQGARSHWSGVELTDKGREWLSVNSAVA